MPHERPANPIEALNHDRHADDLLGIARALGGYPEATAVRAEAVDRFGVDLRVDAPTGDASVRVDFAEAIPEENYPEGVRVAFVRLARHARPTP